MDLVHIGKYGVKNAAVLLDTTSNNISNVATTGYTRRRTNTYTSTIEWGVGETVTSRVYNVFVQRQMYEDLGKAKYFESYLSGLNATDSMLSDTNMSMATSFDNFFNSISDSVQTPTSIGAREEVLAELHVMENRFNTLNKAMMEEVVSANNQIQEKVVMANEYLKSINNINREIRSLAGAEGTAVTGSNNNEIYLELLDNRDLLINQLSEVVEVKVVNQDDGTYSVYLSSGQLLANADSYAELTCEDNPYDGTRTDIFLSFAHYAGAAQDNTHVKMSSSMLRGSIGGLMDSTNDVRQSMRDLGQLAAAFCDAMNVQNMAGITLSGHAGGELCSFTTEVIGRGSVTGETCHAIFERTQGEKYPDCDFYVSRADDGELNIYLIGKDGIIEKEPIVSIPDTIPGDYDGTNYSINANHDSVTLKDYGLTLTFGDSAFKYSGNFVLQPTLNAATSFKVKVTDPSDLAYASAVVTNTYENNFGNAVITMQGMTETDESEVINPVDPYSHRPEGPHMGVYLDKENQPQFYADAPQLIRIDTNGDYVIYEKNIGNDKETLTCTGGSHTAELQMSLTTFEKAMNLQPGDPFKIECTISNKKAVFTYDGRELEVTRSAVGSNYVYSNAEFGIEFTISQQNINVYSGSATDNYTIDLTKARTNGEKPMYTEIGRAEANTQGQNIFANALTNTEPAKAFSELYGTGGGYPGFEVSVTGIPAPGDCFEIAINSDPYADNSNGVKLAAMRNADTTRSSDTSQVSFSEAYANMTSALGAAAFEANTDYEAAQSKYEQTKTVYDSVAGVQLDEEAANLVLYQQTYSACAKIIEASQTIFNALINVV